MGPGGSFPDSGLVRWIGGRNMVAFFIPEMTPDLFVPRICKEFSLQVVHVSALARLLAEGATVPFIARYRKEVTGGMDEVVIASVRDRLAQLKEMEERREFVIQSIKERGLMTDALERSLRDAETLARLEDIYQPFKPKRRTRAQAAREKGLEPLAQLLWDGQDKPGVSPEAEAAAFVSAEHEVVDAAAALAGARDIIAEWVNDDADTRAELREYYLKHSVLSSKVIKGKEEEGAKFRDYFDWSEPVDKAPSHRILAIRRGEAEGFLYMLVRPDEETALGMVKRRFVKGSTPCAAQVAEAVEDGFKRLLSVSMETAVRMELKKRADVEAVRVFSENLRELLLAPALGGKPVLAIDPGFRTGCKVVVLDAQGKLIFDTVVYPTSGEYQREQAATIVAGLVQRFQVSAVAIGNGTASRETESFVRGLGLPASVAVVMVNESGASIYSASDVAREEFPEKDITVRGAVSIGRRLMDPLAELVKIDPKSIGVGQYQHDVDQKILKESLEDVVLSCVNSVGVEVNTASKQLLSYVSGLNARLAGEIVKHRESVGAIGSRKELLKVSGIGPKAFEQAAGFLRIRGAKHPLDASAVHPERYALVEQMAADLGVSVADLISSDALRKQIKVERYVSEDVGLPTLKDILSELARPGRDPREQFEVFQFREGVEKIDDLREGMKLPGIVTNVTAFGAFVDIGVHQDGLVHVSQLSDNFVKNPADVVKVGQKVQVTVTEVDIPRKRIGLSMKTAPEKGATPGRSDAPGSPQGGAGHGGRGPNGRPGSGGGNRPPSGGGNRPSSGRGGASFGGGLGDAFGKLGL